jgi:CzcA family heavy metal efflux pump
MLRSIVGASLKYRLVVIPLAAVMMYFALDDIEDAPVAVFPEFAPPYVEVQTEALGLSAAEVEQMITVPLEADLLNGVAWVKDIRSQSMPGLSSVVLVFEPGTDLMRARQMVGERLTQAHALPNVSKPPAMLQPLSSSSRVMMIGLSSKEISPIELSVLARWTIRPRLMGVEGVANVAIWGQRERQLQVQVDPARLRDKKVSLLQVISTTGNALWVSPLSFLSASTPGTGGFIDTPNQRLGIRHILPISSPEELAKVPVEDVPNGTLRLGDVTTVVEDHQPLIGDALSRDGPGLLLVVEKFPEANTLEVSDDLEDALDKMAAGLTGVQVDSHIFRPASFIERTARELKAGLLIGGLLLLLALAALFFEWRTAAISLVAIPVSLVAALLVLQVQRVTFNAMIVAGLAVALVLLIDDAVTTVENIARRLRENRLAGNPRSVAATVFDASLEVRSPLVFATLILLVAVAPVFFLEGVYGAFFKPMVWAYVLAVMASMLVALTVTPALALLLFSWAPKHERESPIVRRFGSGFDRLLSRLMHAPRLALGVVAVLALVGMAAGASLREQSLLPSLEERDLLIHLNAASGTSHPEMRRVAARAVAELRTIPGVRNVGGHVGRAIMSDQVVNVSSSDLWVSIDPSADYDSTLASIREVVDGYPGFSGEMLTYSAERVKEVLTGSKDPIVVRVYGENLSVVRAEAEKVRQALSEIEGIVDPRVERVVVEPTLEIEVNLAAAQKHGIKPGDVRRAATTLLAGLEVGSLFEEQKVFDVVVWGKPEIRRSLSNVRELLVDTPGGGHVRLADVASVRIVPAANVIKRESVSKRLDVFAGVQGRTPGAVGRDVQNRLEQLEFPMEYHAELLGTYAEGQAARHRMAMYLLAAVIGIFLLLQAAYRSWQLAFLGLVSLPLALVGGILALLATGGEISLGSLAGFVVLLGLTVRGSILLIARYQQLQADGASFGPELVLQGTRDRLQPILTTALATALTLAPFALVAGIPGGDVVEPMAVVILGGVVTTTWLNLLLVPALYLRFGESRAPEPSLAPAAEHPNLGWT